MLGSAAMSRSAVGVLSALLIVGRVVGPQHDYELDLVGPYLGIGHRVGGPQDPFADDEVVMLYRHISGGPMTRSAAKQALLR